MEFTVAILVILIALVFDFTNGFHDAANAIATSVSTRAMSPKVALSLAAVMNLLGALLGTAVATTIAKDIVDLTGLNSIMQLELVMSALVGAIGWNLITWWFGLPSSSSHALIGGLMGAGLSTMIFSDTVHIKWNKIIDKVIEPMFLSPLVGFLLAYLLMLIFQWVLRKRNPARVFGKFRVMQVFSSAALALGHGLQDAQKSMGIIFMACAATGIFGVSHNDETIPFVIMVMCALAIGAGTFAGGKRIMKTLGTKIVDIDPTRAFAAEAVSASVLYVTAFFVHAPISTTHTVTSAILGSGATKSVKSVRWQVAGNIMRAWFLTIPASGLLAFAVHQIIAFVL